MIMARTRLSIKELERLMSRDLMLDAKTCFKLGICDRVLALDFTKRVSKIKFDDVIKKTHVNHVTFSTSREEDVKKTTEEQQEDPSKKDPLKKMLEIDAMLSAGSYLKPVIVHVDSSSNSWKVSPAIIARVCCLSKHTLTYGIIDTHVGLLDFIPILFCHKRVMYAHAVVVIHMVYSNAWAWMLRDVVENTDLSMASIRAILKEKTRMPAELIENIHAQRTLLLPEDCLKYGLVDEVISLY